MEKSGGSGQWRPRDRYLTEKYLGQLRPDLLWMHTALL